MWIQQNPNPLGRHVGDCVIRALSIALGESWEKIYLDLCAQGLMMADMPSSNQVWGAYLQSKGFRRYSLPDRCPNCYTVKDFCNDHKNGVYVLGTGTHVITVVNGHYIDDWDSGNNVPDFAWTNKGV